MTIVGKCGSVNDEDADEAMIEGWSLSNTDDDEVGSRLPKGGCAPVLVLVEYRSHAKVADLEFDLGDALDPRISRPFSSTHQQSRDPTKHWTAAKAPSGSHSGMN